MTFEEFQARILQKHHKQETMPELMDKTLEMHAVLGKFTRTLINMRKKPINDAMIRSMHDNLTCMLCIIAILASALGADAEMLARDGVDRYEG